jgi:hypothetical protein
MAGFHEAPVTNTLRVDYQFTNSGSPIGGSRMFFTYTPPAPSISQLQNLVNNVNSAWVGNLAALTHPNTSLASVSATDIGTTAGSFASDTTAVAGTRTGGELPVNNCVLINSILGTRYRGGKPKNFFPGGTDADTTNGKQWIGAFTQAYTTSWSAFLLAHNTAVPALNLLHVCVHYYKGFEPDPTPTTWGHTNIPKPLVPPQTEPIVQFRVNSIIGSQRRRLRIG